MFTVFRADYMVYVLTDYSLAIIYSRPEDYEHGLGSVIRVVRAGCVVIRDVMLWLG